MHTNERPVDPRKGYHVVVNVRLAYDADSGTWSIFTNRDSFTVDQYEDDSRTYNELHADCFADLAATALALRDEVDYVIAERVAHLKRGTRNG